MADAGGVDADKEGVGGEGGEGEGDVLGCGGGWGGEVFLPGEHGVREGRGGHGWGGGGLIRGWVEREGRWRGDGEMLCWV